MIHGYHIILAHYGFWLPNDPRGSHSEFVASWEIARFGKTTQKLEQRRLDQISEAERSQRKSAQTALKYPSVSLNGRQALSIAQGFASKVRFADYPIWACSILPEHTHLVVGRHRLKAEQMANLLKGAATRKLLEDDNHPLANYAQSGKRPPGMWARHQWISYLDGDTAIENAMAYVIENPIKEGKKRQNWKWLGRYPGLDHVFITYNS